MLIKAIRSVEAQLVVIDNNTEDPETRQPVEEYCRNRPQVRFVHVENLRGFKSGHSTWCSASSGAGTSGA